TPPFAVAEFPTQIVYAVPARCEDRWELAALRREYHRPREDLEILKRAAAIFTAATRSAQPFVEAESLNSKVRQSGNPAAWTAGPHARHKAGFCLPPRRSSCWHLRFAISVAR